MLLILGMPLALLGGFLILLMSIGGALGCGLMIPAVSAEGTDAFDAVSRAFSYVYSRPWRFLWYHVVALAYAIPSCLFVWAFTQGFIQTSLKLGRLWVPKGSGVWTVFNALGPGLGGTFSAASFSSGPLVWLVTCLVSALLYVLVGMAVAYPISYAFSARTVIYFLLRKAVDGVEMGEVYEEESEEELVAGGSPAGTLPPSSGTPPQP